MSPLVAAWSIRQTSQPLNPQTGGVAWIACGGDQTLGWAGTWKAAKKGSAVTTRPFSKGSSADKPNEEPPSPSSKPDDGYVAGYHAAFKDVYEADRERSSDPNREWEVWIRSGARQKALLRRLIASCVAVSLAMLAIVGWFWGDNLGLSERGELAIVILLFSLAFVAGMTSVLFEFAARARFVQDFREDRARKSVAQALDDLSETPTLAELIRANRTQMQQYDVLARGQASSSYRNSQIAIGVGLVVLISGAIAALAADSTASKVTTTTLTAVGGVLAGYIGRTFLKAYSQALSQLNFYFEQPLINSYILSAERLILNMSKGQDAAFAELVRHVVAARIGPQISHIAPSGDGRAPPSPDLVVSEARER